MAVNEQSFIDRVLSDPTVQSKMHALKIEPEMQAKLCGIFFHFFIESSANETYLSHIKHLLREAAAVCSEQPEYKRIIEQLADNVHRHSLVFITITERLNATEAKCESLTLELQRLKTDFETMNEKLIRSEALIMSNEIASLYIQYFVKPVLLRRCGNASWDKFTNSLSTIETEMDNTRLRKVEAGEEIDDEELYKSLVTFLEPIQREINISLTDIRFLKQDRVDIAHIRNKSVKDQWALIEMAKSFNFPSKFEHMNIVLAMVTALEQHKPHFRRCI